VGELLLVYKGSRREDRELRRRVDTPPRRTEKRKKTAEFKSPRAEWVLRVRRTNKGDPCENGPENNRDTQKTEDGHVVFLEP